MASFSARICRRNRSDPLGSKAAPRRDGALLPEFFIVEHGVADETCGEGATVGERFGGREVITEAENQAVRAVIGSGAEETGHDDARFHRHLWGLGLDNLVLMPLEQLPSP